MLSQLSRASVSPPRAFPMTPTIACHCARAGSAAAVVARSARRNVQVRSFIAPTVSRRADFVQELYLKELKAYKMPPVKETDAEGQVQAFAMPKTPASPEETDLAGSLQEYESMAVEIEGQDATQANQGAAALPDWLEAEEEEPRGH
ncbi:Cellobiose dehydrogenase [Tolypocladium capitatum]|uniref:Cellobiose dehydrogenase n=1 Tax=Tolypocladium capitatum TaxID=45235 RepID=A0A2K3QGR3_9HYPO|nr:Cellobiose dehydrogenase [Tolypocladium capitatum]